MKVNIESVHFRTGKKLVLFINERIEKLVEHHQKILNIDVVLELGNKPDNKIVEIKLNYEGRLLYAKKQSDTFEKSVDLAVEALRRQLRKKKTITRRKKRFK